MAGDYRLDGLAVPESLTDLHELLERVRAEHPQIGVTDLMLFETAVVEIHGNVVQHGRPPGQVSYVFSLGVADDRLEATLTTTGEAVPGLSGGSAPGLPEDPLADSGRGIWLAETALDELHFSRDDDLNVWRMTKLLDDRSRPAPTG